MDQIEVAAKWEPASDRQLAKTFIYIRENSRELWYAALWEGLPANRPLPPPPCVLDQKHQTFRGLRTSFPPRDIRNNPPNPGDGAIVPYHGSSRAYGLHPRLWHLFHYKGNIQAFHLLGCSDDKNWLDLTSNCFKICRFVEFFGLPVCFLRRIHLGFVVIESNNCKGWTRPELFSGRNSTVVYLTQGNAQDSFVIRSTNYYGKKFVCQRQQLYDSTNPRCIRLK